MRGEKACFILLVYLYGSLLVCMEADKPVLPPLHQAAYAGDSKQLKNLLKGLTNEQIVLALYKCDKDGKNILHFAAMKNQLVIIEQLAKNCPGLVLKPDNSGTSPLALAYQRGNNDAATIMLNSYIESAVQSSVQSHLSQLSAQLIEHTRRIWHEIEMKMARQEQSNAVLQPKINKGWISGLLAVACGILLYQRHTNNMHKKIL